MEHTTETAKKHEHSTHSNEAASVSVTAPLSPALQLQQQAGNQAMQQLLRSGVIQPKLAISAPSDPAEREADQVAQTIMRSPVGFPVASPCSCGDGEEMCDSCGHSQSPTTVHRSASAASAHTAPATINRAKSSHAPNLVHDVLRSPGLPLNPSTRSFFEPRFGHDFSQVRIHTGSEASASARSIQANAYTAGSDIVFAQGQYSPDSTSGQTLLAHELTHVIQQGCVGTGSSQRSLSLIQRQVFGEVPELGDFGEPGIEIPPPPGIEAPPQVPEPPSGAPPGEQIYPRPTPQNFPGQTPTPQGEPWIGSQPTLIPPLAPFPGEDTSPDEEKKRRRPQCGSRELPYSTVFFPKQGRLGQGLQVKASPLTRCPGNTVGSKPSQSIYKDQFDCINAAGKGGDWLRGHILHGKTDRTGDRNLHGPGNTPENLIIIDQSLNQKMLSWLEKVVLDLLYGPYPHVLWYRATVDSYHPGLEFFADSISVEYGRFDTNTGTELPAYRTEQFVIEETPPHCPATGFEGGVFPLLHGSGFTAGVEQKARICDGGLSLANFDVPDGGVSVDIDTKWVRNDGSPFLPSDRKFNCPEKYSLSLYMKRPYFFNKEISQHDLRIGTRIMLPWKYLGDDMEYYLRIEFDPPRTDGAGQGAGAEPEPPGPDCCLEVDVIVIPFSAPRKRPGMELA